MVTILNYIYKSNFINSNSYHQSKSIYFKIEIMTERNRQRIISTELKTTVEKNKNKKKEIREM